MSDELNLKEKMVRSRLIQRLKKPLGVDDPFAFGGGLANGGLSGQAMGLLREIFSFDYMGSAQFEWGVVPAALSFIAQEANKRGHIVSGEHQGVYYICPKPYEKDVKKLINTLLVDESSLRLREYCGLEKATHPSRDTHHQKTVGWLELDNGFFFFTDKKMYRKTKYLFGIK